MDILRPKPLNIKSVNKREFEEIYFKKTRPILFKELNKDMPAYEKWNFTFFKDKGENILCYVSDDLDEPDKITRKISISEYVSLLEGEGKCPYMTGWAYQKHMPELDMDITFGRAP